MYFRPDDSPGLLDQLIADMDAYPLLRADEEATASREQLITCNLRLVISIAKRYLGRGLEIDDLVAEGWTGLIRAADKFRPELGNKFSTMATWWIKQAITRAIEDKGKTVRTPVHVAQTRRAIAAARDAFLTTHGRYPTDAELSAASGRSARQIALARWVEQQQIYSLDSPWFCDQLTSDDPGEVTLLSILEDPSDGPDRQTLNHDTRDRLAAALAQLGERERTILLARYGERTTLEEVGARLGITRERARQIERDALKKLRDDPAVQALGRAYFDS